MTKFGFAFLYIALLIVDKTGDDGFLPVKAGEKTFGCFLLPNRFRELIKGRTITVGLNLGDIQRKILQKHQKRQDDVLISTLSVFTIYQSAAELHHVERFCFPAFP
jgi:hypothetical protein